MSILWFIVLTCMCCVQAAVIIQVRAGKEIINRLSKEERDFRGVAKRTRITYRIYASVIVQVPCIHNPGEGWCRVVWGGSSECKTSHFTPQKKILHGRSPQQAKLIFCCFYRLVVDPIAESFANTIVYYWRTKQIEWSLLVINGVAALTRR